MRKVSVLIQAEQERDRRTGLLFRLAKLCSEAVSDESVWLEVEGDNRVHHWMLSSDPEEVKVFVACHFCGLQAEHKWNQDPAVWPLYHDGPHKGMLCCPLKLQVIFDWLDNNCPDEVIYSSLHWHMKCLSSSRFWHTSRHSQLLGHLASAMLCC